MDETTAPHAADTGAVGPDQGLGPDVAARPVDAVCPFLVATSGGWRSATPSGANHCAAVDPPASLTTDKQRRLCLVQAHAGCATYVAAGEARLARVGSAAMPARTGRWGLVRTTALVEDDGGARGVLGTLASDRRVWQSIPVIVLLVAVAALGINGLGRSGGQTALGSPSPAPTGIETFPTSSPEPTLTPEPSPTPEPSSTPVPSATPAPSPSGTPAPSPSARTTYTVKSGDSLWSIARKFNTTVSAISALNGISSTKPLHAGQVLLIP